MAEFELNQDIVVFHASIKSQEDQIKNEGAGVLTTLNINFSDIQGLLTLSSFMVSG